MRYEIVALQPFRGEVEQFDASLAQPFVGVVGLGASHSAVYACCRNPAFFKIVHLVLHQGDKRRYHHCEAVEYERRDLECERFAAPCGQQPYGVAA